ncbi:hypothetical protein ACRALDRAFT_210881 [Sodiomyces alcalophilus JCM 7366]|uniref:uncharacterized protein n=1 Tax=Sodiomyces alcalophilus JCM 7366 TaxID=591952 RepID=UPI0039B66B42
MPVDQKILNFHQANPQHQHTTSLPPSLHTTGNVTAGDGYMRAQSCTTKNDRSKSQHKMKGDARNRRKREKKEQQARQKQSSESNAKLLVFCSRKKRKRRQSLESSRVIISPAVTSGRHVGTASMLSTSPCLSFPHCALIPTDPFSQPEEQNEKSSEQDQTPGTFPNMDFEVQGTEDEYDGDRFVEVVLSIPNSEIRDRTSIESGPQVDIVAVKCWNAEESLPRRFGVVCLGHLYVLSPVLGPQPKVVRSGHLYRSAVTRIPSLAQGYPVKRWKRSPRGRPDCSAGIGNKK